MLSVIFLAVVTNISALRPHMIAAASLSDIPSAVPLDTPTAVPSDTPSAAPSDTPSAMPSVTPTFSPEFGVPYNINTEIEPPVIENIKVKNNNVTVNANNSSQIKASIQIKKKRYSYSDMSKDIKYLAKHHNVHCRYKIIGKTCRNRNIYDVIIGNSDAKKSLLMVNTLHAREYVCSVFAMKMINYYLNNYNKRINGIRPSDILENIQLHVIVMANPDGVAIAQNSNSRWKANSRGVDLNRNYPVSFKVKGKKGASGFTGYKAASEPETKAIIKLTKSLKSNYGLCAVINYHAMGQIIFGGYGDSKAAVGKQINDIYMIAKRLTGYSSAGGYPTSSGNYREYVMYILNIPSITLEVGKTSCPVAYSEYNSIFNKNKLVPLFIASYFMNNL